jgi:hypothetical protein
MKIKDRSLELDFARKLAAHHGVPDVNKLFLLDLLVCLGELLEKAKRSILEMEESDAKEEVRRRTD